MGWVSLSLRKQSLRQAINDTEMQDIALSRQLRSFQRQSSYDQTIFNNDKTQELRDAKEPLDEMRKNRLSVDDPNYEEWREQYEEAKEDYEAEKLNINDYYDDIMNELEEESSDTESRIVNEQDQLQVQLEAMRQELESVSEAISSDIQSTAIKLS